MTDLTDDETTVLMIAADGHWLAPIGRWEKPIRNLQARKLLFERDPHNYGITPDGRQALAAQELANDRALGNALQKVARAAPVQSALSDFAEQAAHHLVDAAKTSAAVTGDPPEIAARKWVQVILDRTLELLREPTR